MRQSWADEVFLDRELRPVSSWGEMEMEMEKGEELARPRQLEDECAELGVMEHETSELEIGRNKNVSGQETIVGVRTGISSPALGTARGGFWPRAPCLAQPPTETPADRRIMAPEAQASPPQRLCS